MFLALFPLQLVVFPGEVLPLHIFEARYKALINECRADGITFGIPAQIRGHVALYGTEVELVRLLKTYSDGEMDIVVVGLRVFHVEELRVEVPEKLYSGGTVRLVENDSSFDAEVQKRLLERFNQLQRLRAEREYPEPDVSDNFSFRLAHEVGLSLVQKIDFLAMGREEDRQKTLLNQIERILPLAAKSTEGPPGRGENGHARQLGLSDRGP